MPVSPGGNGFKHDSVESAGVVIAYSWCHSRRTTLGLTVRPDKTVSVRVPLRTSVRSTREFVADRAEWILKVWKRLDAQPSRHEQSSCSGALFMFHGERFQLIFETGTPLSLQIRDNFLVMTSADLLSEADVGRMIDSWYRKQAARIVTERSSACHYMMRSEEIPLPPITLRSMKTRWGSYSYRTGRITLNINLVKTPPACLDYVIIHELCHIKLRHHGPDFWQLVARYQPDYLLLRRQLRQYS